MAIRIDASGDLLRRSTDLPSTTYTIMGWIYLVNDRNNFGIVFELLNNTATVYQLAYLAADGTTLSVGTNATNAGGTSLSTATWYHVTYTRSGDVHTVYLNGVQDSQVTSAVSFTPAFLIVGSDGTNWADIRADSIKVWSGVALSVDEIKNEMWFRMPQRTNNIHMVTPLLTNNRAIDYSGSARDWTEIGTITSEDSHGVIWHANPRLNLIKYAAPQNSSINAASSSSAGLALTTNYIQTINNASASSTGNQVSFSVGAITITVNKSDATGIGQSLSSNYIQAINLSDSSAIGHNVDFSVGGVNVSINNASASAIGNNLDTVYVQSLGQAISAAIGYDLSANPGGITQSVNLADSSANGYDVLANYIQSINYAISSAIGNSLTAIPGNFNQTVNLANSDAIGYEVNPVTGTPIDVNKSDASGGGYQLNANPGNVDVTINLASSSAVGYTLDAFLNDLTVTVNHAVSSAVGNTVNFTVGSIIVSVNYAVSSALGHDASIGTFVIILSPDRIYRVITDNRIYIVYDDRIYDVQNDDRSFELLN